MKCGALLLLLLVTCMPVVADEDAARYFTRRGREALASGDHVEAEKQFTKALSEERGFLPAMFGLAEAAQAREDRDSAITFLEACLDEARGKILSSEEGDVVRRAQEMLKKLDRARLEYRELLGDYVDALLKLARSSEEKDPELARRCADRVLRLDPTHEEAKAIRGRVGASAPAAAGVDAGGDAEKGEILLFAGKGADGWDGITELWTVENGLIVGDITDGANYINHEQVFKGNYTLCVTMRIPESRENPRVGISFGLRATYDRFDFNTYEKTFGLNRYDKSDERVSLGRVDVFEAYTSFNRSEWHEYEVKVEGKRVTASLDGKVLFKHEAEEGAYDGVPALVVQNCRAEFKRVSVKQ